MTKTNPKMEWMILRDGIPLGWPSRLEFATRKMALQRAQQIQHQGGGDVVAVRISEFEGSKRAKYLKENWP